MSDSTLQDVTNAAQWQSSAPAIAVVSASGVVTGFVQGEVTISATFIRTGTLALQIKKECRYTLSPSSSDFDAFGRAGVKVAVASSLASCRWTARSDVAWLRIVGSAAGTGSGGFEYDLTGNSTPGPRTTEIVVSGEGGTSTHHVSQAKPSSCSYVVDPDEVAISVGGGSGSFRVDPAERAVQLRRPSTCSAMIIRWTSEVPW
ncbi:MAG TPA: Ig-like domain-containing protein [Vicinamibacterales bacterium]|nr:Ig-like domain-containing protein [Vicinamibacterales bacterium]